MEYTKYKILLIEDDNFDRMAFERFVDDHKLKYECTEAKSISEAKEVLKTEKFDIIISDYSLSDGTALDILNSVKDMPIILTTGAADEQVAIQAWKAGAYDYLPKDHGLNYLEAVPKAIEDAIKRKTMEDALDRKQKDLEAIFDAAPVGMLLTDENKIVVRVNDTIRQLLHKEYTQIIHRPIGLALGCINCTDSDQGCGFRPVCSECLITKAMNRVLDSGQSVREVVIHPTLKLDNEQIRSWFCIGVNPVMIGDRKHLIIAMNDITQRKRAEDELRLAEEKYRTIFENSAAAITVADDQERLISWNKFLEGLLGMNKEDLYLRPIRSLYPPGEWERIRACRIRQKGMQHHFETSLLKKDTSPIEVDISLSILENSEGKFTGSIGVIRDITERKKAEEKLKETMELKSQFISTVSHELRTPLAAMKEGLAIVLDGVVGRVNKKQKKFLSIAKRNADRLNDLINDVLDFQKLGAGKMKLDLQIHDIEKVLSEVQETMSLFAKKHGVELLFDFAGGLSQAEFDRAKIIQVLTNLVSNAIKFTPEEGQVSVNARQQDNNWVISVSDTGMGIPKEALPKIFDRFYRVNRPGKQIQGTGLGLAIVHKIVMLHGGTIEVESKVDHGTTFTIFLPLEVKSLPEQPSETVDEVLENTITIPG
jgi:PAS domain S-box-containing protein